MVVIGAADARYRGVYAKHETEWRDSWQCVVAGFFGLVSSEVSALVICLVTLDRFLKLCLPLRPACHFGSRACTILCGLAWLCGLGLAALPLLARLPFYGTNGLCLPLPITRQAFGGYGFSFGVFVVTNFVLFLLIGAGQAAIYCAVRASAKAMRSTKQQQQDTAVARRLFSVVLTDFCCWVPVGVLGIMAFCDVPIPAEVTVWMAIFVMPINSVINPYLYTFNMMIEKRTKKNLKQKMRMYMKTFEANIQELPETEAQRFVLSIFRHNRSLQSQFQVSSNGATLSDSCSNGAEQA